MMKHPKAIKGIVFGFLVSIAISWITTCQEAKDTVSFDILFPQNWYTRTLQSCMEIWHDLDRIIGDQDMQFAERHLFIDASIGKIAYCCSCFENRVNHTKIEEDDVAYLMRIVQSLVVKCDELAGRQFDDKLACLQTNIKKLNSYLYSLLEPHGP